MNELTVKRNRGRFPGDFMFRLTEQEKQEVVANCDHLSRLKYSKYLPYAFTEHGVGLFPPFFAPGGQGGSFRENRPVKHLDP
jgi:hypothetical protein